MATTNTPTFLIELIHQKTGDVVECDVTSYLENAIEAAYVYLKGFDSERFTPEVSYDDDGAIEGIAFFDRDGRGRAYITAYYLDRDEANNEFTAVAALAKLPIQKLESALSDLLD